MIKDISIPDIGNYDNVEIIEVAVKPGDTVKLDDTLITLETEKASMDVPAPFDGVLKDLSVKVGDKVSKGDVFAHLEVATQSTEEEKTAISEPTPEKATQPLEQEETVCVPDTGGQDKVEVIEVAISAGDSVNEEDTLITLESEKASMDIPSPFKGTVVTVLVKVGDKVAMDSPIAIIKSTKTVSESVTSATPEASSPAKSTKPAPKPAPVMPKKGGRVHAGPATRRLARELGVELEKVGGTGRKHRIVTADVKAFVKALMQGAKTGQGFNIEASPEIDFTQFGDVQRQPLSRIKKWTGKNLHRNWVTIPHITQFDEADITELEAFRQENKKNSEYDGIKLTPLPFIMKAVLSALKTFEQFNASLSADGTELIYKKYYNLGIAVDTPNGLVVPVVKNIDTKGLFDMAKDVGELSTLAREGKLKQDQMQGSCFTISSLGSIGGTAFTPIINAPDVAILGVSKAQIKPVYMNSKFVPRKMLPLSLSYDHRVIDGVEAAKFVTHISSQLQDIRKLLL